MANYRSQSPDGKSPVAEAMQWVSRITTVALMTVLPILAGRWLDDRWATSYCGLVGLVVGLSLGFWQLMLLAKSAGAKGAVSRKSAASDRESPGDGDSGASAGRSAVKREAVNPASLSSETAEIAKRIDEALGKKKELPDREA